MSIATPVRERVLTELPEKDQALQQWAAEQASILLSLENLHSFPWIDERVARGELTLHGWYFDLAAGELFGYAPEQGCFEMLR